MSTTATAIKTALDLHRRGDTARAEALYREVLATEPDNASALHYLGLIEQGKGRLAVAVEMIARSVALKPEQPSAWNNLGGALLELDRTDESIRALDRALVQKPEYPMALQNLARALQRAGRVEESIHTSERQLLLQPGNPEALWNVELCRRELSGASEAQSTGALNTVRGHGERWLTILLTCFGDFPDVTVRCLDSLLGTPRLRERCDVRIGCNAIGERTRKSVRGHFDAGRITSLIDSTVNLHKGPMARLNMALVETPYVLVVDDDAQVSDGWLEALEGFVDRYHPFDVAGQIFSVPRDEEMQDLVRARSWWRGDEAGHPAYRDVAFFATGGFHLGRTAFLREHGYPDPAVRLRHATAAGTVRRPCEDIMLGEYANQVGGRLLRFTRAVMDHVRINDAPTRGGDVTDVASA